MNNRFFGQWGRGVTVLASSSVLLALSGPILAQDRDETAEFGVQFANWSGGDVTGIYGASLDFSNAQGKVRQTLLERRNIEGFRVSRKQGSVHFKRRALGADGRFIQTHGELPDFGHHHAIPHPGPDLALQLMQLHRKNLPMFCLLSGNRLLRGGKRGRRHSDRVMFGNELGKLTVEIRA